MISSGSTGMMMPKPIESIRIVMKMKRTARRFGMGAVWPERLAARL
jgi:hypothetical protein